MSLGTRNITQRVTVTTDAAVTLDGDGYSMPHPIVVSAYPGTNGTLLVERQTAQGGKWKPWPAGTVSVDTTEMLDGPSHGLRFTAAVANGIVEVAQ